MIGRIAGGSLGAVVVALMALALTPTFAMADVEPNDGIEQAEGPLAGGVNHDGVISTDNDRDWYLFYVPQRAQMEIRLSTLERGTSGSCCSDTLATLRDTNGDDLRSLRSDVDSPDVLNITLDPGRYLISVGSSFTGNRYRLRIDPPESVGEGPAPTAAIVTGEPNDTREQAFGPLGHGQPYSGTIDTDNDADWFTFFTGAPGPVEVALTNTGSCFVRAELYDETEDTFESGGASPDFTRRFQFTAPGAGRYFVRMTGDCVGAAYQISVAGVISTSPPPSAAPPTAVTPGPSGTLPAKFQVRRAQIAERRLDILVDVTQRANGDEVDVEFHARGRRHTFTERVENGRLRFKEPLPSGQRSASTGIVTLRYAGNDRVRPDEVRLRAASRHANLRRSLLSLQDGVLLAEGRITSRARGVVRLRLTYDRPDGTVGAWDGRASISDGRWRVEETLPEEARNGGYLTLQFTGYQRRNMRGEQIAKELLAGQVFETG